MKYLIFYLYLILVLQLFLKLNKLIIFKSWNFKIKTLKVKNKNHVYNAN